MAPQSDYLDRAVLRWGFEAVAFPDVPTVYVALYTAPPSKAGGGTEVSALGYARTATLTSQWSVSGPPWRVSNNVVLQLGTPGALWGTLLAFGLLDALSGGNLLYHGTLLVPRTPLAGQPVVFSIGALAVQGS